MLVKIYKYHQDVIIPFKADFGSSGYDLFSREEKRLEPYSSHLFGLQFSLDIPHGYEAQIRSRSGLALKHRIIVLNSPGTIDSSYTGEMGVIIFNANSTFYDVKIGDKIAQMVFCSLPEVSLKEDCIIKSTVREGGFGSTGY